MLDSWQQFLQLLEQTDRRVFQLINRQLSWSGFDGLFPLWRTPEFWTPLYLFLLLFMVRNFGKKAGWWIAYFVMTVSLMDTIGNKLIKQTVQRLRPCNDPDMMELLVLRVPNCGTGYSFISNHAANHFAMAMFAFLTIGSLVGNWRWLFFLWAFSIGWAQIYVGVHYPSDVLAGALTGILLGGVIGYAFNKRYQLRIFESVTTPSR